MVGRFRKENSKRTTNYVVQFKAKTFPIKQKLKWSGPFIVKEVKPHGATEIGDPITNRSWVVNG